jgi:hypothetical protein
MNGLYRSWRGVLIKHEAFRAVATWAIAVETIGSCLVA